MKEPAGRELLDVPEFVREALEGGASGLDASEAIQALELLAEVPPAEAAWSRGAARPDNAARLLWEISRQPLRYAPFFDRLSALWDLSESDVRAVLARSADARAWQRPMYPGIALFELAGGPRTRGHAVKLVRFAPGLRFPRHRHAGDESVLVLEGSYTDSAGCHVGPGDLQEMSAGSEHALRVARPEPCVAAIVEYRLEFTGFVLGRLQRWFERH